MSTLYTIIRYNRFCAIDDIPIYGRFVLIALNTLQYKCTRCAGLLCLYFGLFIYIFFVFPSSYSIFFSWLLFIVTRRVRLVEQEQPIFPEHLSSPFLCLQWGSLVFYNIFCRSLFVLFHLDMVLFILRIAADGLRYFKVYLII